MFNIWSFYTFFGGVIWSFILCIFLSEYAYNIYYVKTALYFNFSICKLYMNTSLTGVLCLLKGNAEIWEVRRCSRILLQNEKKRGSSSSHYLQRYFLFLFTILISLDSHLFLNFFMP